MFFLLAISPCLSVCSRSVESQSIVWTEVHIRRPPLPRIILSHHQRLQKSLSSPSSEIVSTTLPFLLLSFQRLVLSPVSTTFTYCLVQFDPSFTYPTIELRLFSLIPTSLDSVLTTISQPEHQIYRLERLDLHHHSKCSRRLSPSLLWLPTPAPT